MLEINKILEDYLNTASLSVKQVLMAENIKHPEWEDNAEIMEIAKQQMLASIDVLSDESVLAFIGVHAKIPLIGKRHSIGFLITNYRVVIQTEVTLVNRDTFPKIEYFIQRADADEMGIRLWDDFSTKNTLVTSEEQLEGMQIALKDSLKLILPKLQGLNYLPEEIKKATSIEGRIKELNLHKVLKATKDEQKLISKFIEKCVLVDVDILYAVLDRPLFSSPYGLVITKTGIISRGFGEKRKKSSWEEIINSPAIVGEEEAQLSIGGKKHVIPTYQKEHLPAIINLINEIAQGTISI
ncbi:hypothetical protein VSP10_03740 [Myroides odoratimimus]|uniref:hypothetical protein n=1 Tax=Myroides odoratimimus TaxID=76832 RepID=UPI002DB9BABD|nr:hypothetical protein [Myroides odoratimimus]MEC4051894.1 hypothetical protein [Myroides odoratimimus]